MSNMDLKYLQSGLLHPLFIENQRKSKLESLVQSGTVRYREFNSLHKNIALTHRGDGRRMIIDHVNRHERFFSLCDYVETSASQQILVAVLETAEKTFQRFEFFSSSFLLFKSSKFLHDAVCVTDIPRDSRVLVDVADALVVDAAVAVADS